MGPRQLVPLAELRALDGLVHLLDLQLSATGRVPGLVVAVVDCEEVNRIFEGGLEAALRPSRLGGGVWRRIFARLARLRARGMEMRVTWTPAHKTLEYYAEAGRPAMHWYGNGAVDEVAKEAAAGVRLEEDTRSRVVAAYGEAVAVARWAVAQHHFSTEFRIWDDDGEERVVRQPSRLPESALADHQIEVRGDVSYCIRCRKQSGSGAGLQKLLAGRCRPFVPGEGDEDAKVHGSHDLWVSRNVVWCRKCGAYSEAATRGLSGECRPASRWGAACIRKLRRGEHPVKAGVLLGPAVRARPVVAGGVPAGF